MQSVPPSWSADDPLGAARRSGRLDPLSRCRRFAVCRTRRGKTLRLRDLDLDARSPARAPVARPRPPL